MGLVRLEWFTSSHRRGPRAAARRGIVRGWFGVYRLPVDAGGGIFARSRVTAPACADARTPSCPGKPGLPSSSHAGSYVWCAGNGGDYGRCFGDEPGANPMDSDEGSRPVINP